MVELTTLFGLAETLAIVIGVIIALQQLRDIKGTREIELETRQVQLLMQLYSRLYDKEFQKQYFELVYLIDFEVGEDFWQRYGPEANLELASSYTSMLGFLNGAGVLVKEKLIDLKLVYRLFSYLPTTLWERLGPLVMKRREQMNQPDIFEYAEYLADELKKIQQVES